jgi:predicted transcriptional regulator of viral defense system
MDNFEKILNIMKNNGGYITTKELSKNNINRYFLTKMIERNQINRISRGYYGLVDYNADEYYKIISMSEKAVFSMNTALYLHNLSDRTPLVFDITVPYYYGGSLRKNKKVNLYFVKSSVMDLGKTEITSPFGMKIKVYDKERTICDIVKNKNNMDMEIFSKAIKNYIKSDDKKLNKLMKYAKELKIENKIREYMEVIL